MFGSAAVLPYSINSAVYEPVQNTKHSCSANDFVFFKILASLLGRSILKVIGLPERKRMDSYLRYGCIERFHFIFLFWTKFIFLHKVHLVEITWREFSYMARFFSFCMLYLERPVTWLTEILTFTMQIKPMGGSSFEHLTVS